MGLVIATGVESMTALADDHARRVARIETIYRQLPLTLASGLANALLTTGVLIPVVPVGRLVPWIVTMFLVGAVRFAGWIVFSCAVPVRPRVWEVCSVLGALASGLLWGVLSATLMPTEEPYPVFVAFVVGGMCAGAVTFNSPHPTTAFAFVVPAMLPLVLWFSVQGTRLDGAMAAMSGLFVASLTLTGVRFGRFFNESMRVRLDLARRTQALAEANDRLRAEIDERQATEAALHHAQKMEAIGNLTTGVAHDINNMLMAISGSAELLQDNLGADSSNAPLLESIFSATERGSRLTRHLLAFARKEVLDPTIIDLNAVLRHLSVLLGATLGKAIRVELRLQESLWPVYVDRNEIERAIVNLAINARDAMPDGGTLTLGTDNVPQPPRLEDDPPEGPCVMVYVKDDGAGMPRAVLERAFDPFFTTKPAGRGSGLGLSQVYGLVKQSGGATHIESATGAGTTVCLFLPRAHRAPGDVSDEAGLTRPRPDRATAADRPARGHVVLLDDEPGVVTVVTRMLRNAGFRVSGFATGAAALDYLDHDATVTALVTDVGLPDFRGDEVARRVRQARPDLPVVFITGYNDVTVLAGEQ